ncbi:MAG: hypothetical protein CMG67_01325 [Candidatus Marinimicrobia bacterium]|nr:hypothetical protein [Candidatus Neomarinimicrobiota bacterium]
MKKLVFLFLIILLFYFKTQNISANQNTFIVDNIEVKGEVIGDRILNRERYLNIGFKKGFKNLIISLLRKSDQKNILSTDLEKIKSLIGNYSIADEKISDGEYNLKLSIVFDKEKILQFFYDKKIPYSISSKLKIIVYPILITDSEIQLFSQNKFFEEWNIENKDFENINFILPIENIEDINFLKKHIDDLEETDLSSLVDNYEIKNSTILILRYDKKKLNVFLKTNLAGLKKINNIEIKVEDLDNKEVRADLIKNLKFYINDLWKDENLVDTSVPAFLTILVKLNRPDTLKEITSKFKNINFIESYSVDELNKDLAKIKIRYLGKIKNLQKGFLENGFELKIDHDQWILNLS